jgi:hypothetical protein
MRVDTRACRQTVRTDMTKRTIVFPNSANAPKNSTFCGQTECTCLTEHQDKQRLFPYTVLTEMEFVYCAVKTDSINIIQVNFRL